MTTAGKTNEGIMTLGVCVIVWRLCSQIILSGLDILLGTHLLA